MATVQDNLVNKAGSLFGFSNWSLGLGSLGNLILWIILSVFVTAIVGFLIYYFLQKRTYRHIVIIFGLLGNIPSEKFSDKARMINVGRAGDKLFYLKKSKRYLPPPTIQVGANKWWYWEREDGELINIGIEDLDAKMKKMNIKFIDTDMRMQRLGIEKNLQFRLQDQGFWNKYGQTIINVVFYVIVTMMIIVLFIQWRKATSDMSNMVKMTSDYMKQATSGGEKSPNSGLVPALILLVSSKFKLKELW